MATTIAKLAGVYGTPGWIELLGSNYQQESDATKLTGAAPGNVGSDNAAYMIAVRIRVALEWAEACDPKRVPILFFDEMHAVHPNVMKVFMDIIDGKVEQAGSGTTELNKFVVIFGSNFGLEAMTKLRQDEMRRRDATLMYDKLEQQLFQLYTPLVQAAMRARPKDSYPQEQINRLGSADIVCPFMLFDDPTRKQILITKADTAIKSLYPGAKMDDDDVRQMVDHLYNLYSSDEGKGGMRILCNSLRKYISSIIADLDRWEDSTRGRATNIRKTLTFNQRSRLELVITYDGGDYCIEASAGMVTCNDAPKMLLLCIYMYILQVWHLCACVWFM
jgi:ATP-dependent Clp protease ATP-binding subunit ClpA